MIRHVMWMLVVMLFSTNSAFSKTPNQMSPIARAVDHPITASHPVRTAGVWRKGIGEFGETFAAANLKARGYHVTEVKLGSNNGVDRVAFKRDPSGVLTEVKFVEVKAHYGKGRPRLGMTKSGPQMSRKWLADWLRKLRNSGPSNKALAKEISTFLKAQRIPIERLGEVHDINLRLGKYTVRNPITLAERSGPMSIERLLKNLASRSRNQEISTWAKRNLSQLEKIRLTRMSCWLTGGKQSRAFDRVANKQLAVQVEKQSVKTGGRALLKAAGPIATAIAISVDAYEIYGHVADFRAGKISKREMWIAVSRSTGGISGAAIGAAGGAELGAAIGALGGPAAPATVPIGAVVGGAAGGIAGYQAGAYAGESAASVYYRTLDKNVKTTVDAWFLQTPLPPSSNNFAA